MPKHPHLSTVFDLSRFGETEKETEHEECERCGEHMLDCECDDDD